MRILVEHGSSLLDNLGDIAMLQVAVERLRALWPSATISIVGHPSTPLSEFVPGVSEVRIHYPASWLRRLFSYPLLRMDQALRARLEVLFSRQFAVAYRPTLMRAIGESDLVVHAGAGVLADAFAPAAIRRLSLFEQAIKARRPTALFGQGVGPLNSSELRRAVWHVFSHASLVSVRDPASARLLTEGLGITEREIPVTGDEALELAFRARRDQRGKLIGFNLRRAPYSGFVGSDTALLDSLAGVLKECSDEPGRAVLPLAVHQSDAVSAREWLRKSSLESLAPQHEMTVSGLLEAISQCRLVVTASYHGAVLALGQGIPAVCFFKTDYYRIKFSGLAELFPGGCHLLDLTEHVQADEVLRIVTQALRLGDDHRELWLRACREQVQSARRAYEQLPALIARAEA